MEGAEKGVDFDPYFEAVKKKVYSGLEIDKLSASSGTRNAITETIAQTARDVRDPLGLVELYDDIEFGVDRSRGQGSYGSADFRTSANPGKYIGKILFHETYLQELARRLDSPIQSPTAKELLRWRTAHEFYHLRGNVLFPKRTLVAREFHTKWTKRGFSREAWLRERNEKAACIFATKYLKSRKSVNLTDKLAKLVVGIQTGLELSQFKIIPQEEFNPSLH